MSDQVLTAPEAVAFLFRWLVASGLSPAEFTIALNRLGMSATQAKTAMERLGIAALAALRHAHPECYDTDGQLRTDFIQRLTATYADAPVAWTVDAEGNLLSPAGTRVATLTRNALLLYDKRIKQALPFTLVDWARLMPPSKD